jgi:hypothetical protein
LSFIIFMVLCYVKFFTKNIIKTTKTKKRYIKPVFGGSSSEPPSPLFTHPSNKSAQDDPQLDQGSGVTRSDTYVSHRKVENRTSSAPTSSSMGSGGSMGGGDRSTLLKLHSLSATTSSSTSSSSSSSTNVMSPSLTTASKPKSSLVGSGSKKPKAATEV